MMTWEELLVATELRGTVLERTPGGFHVDIGLDVTAFLHMNSLGEVLPADAQAREELLASYIGRELALGLLQLDRKTKSVSVLRRVDHAALKAELYQTLAVGQILEGVVKNVLPDRAFIDLGGVDALVEVAGLEVGKRMSFEVVAFNRDIDRIRLKLH